MSGQTVNFPPRIDLVWQLLLNWTGSDSTTISHAIHHHVKRCTCIFIFMFFFCFFFQKWMFPCCWHPEGVWRHVLRPLKLWQSGENIIALSNKHAVAPRISESIHNIVNHQQRRVKKQTKNAVIIFLQDQCARTRTLYFRIHSEQPWWIYSIMLPWACVS